MIIVDLIRNNEGNIYAKLSYHQEKNYLIMKWIGPCSNEEMKNASMRMFQWQQSTGMKAKCRFHLHDTKEIEGAWADAELVQWISNYFFSINYECGLRYNISIVSPDLFSKLSSQELQRTFSKVPTMLCETLSQAEAIVMQQYAEMSF
ncbi:hypothetical protein [Flavobacterium sp.]|uniref:hypothetical protein n=1 Tax=Flavobacterium sp. TaxID=239 RepID=UPI0039E566A7